MLNLKIPLEELREVPFHIAIYCGVPAAVLQEEGIDLAPLESTEPGS